MALRIDDYLFRRAFDEAPAGMAFFRVNPGGDGEVIYANATVSRVTGRSHEELLGAKFGQLAPEAERDELRFVWNQVARDREPVSLERRLVHPDGGMRWIELDLFPLDLPEAATLVGACFRDITERKRAARALEARSAIVRVLAQASSVQGAVPALMFALAESLQFEFAGLWSPAEDGDELRCGGIWVSREVTLRAFPELSRTLALAPGVGLPGRAWQSGEIEWSPDLAEDPRCPRAAAAAADGLHAAVAFPISVGPSLYGVLELVSLRAGELDGDLRDLVAEIAEEVGALLARKRAQERSPTSSELLLVEDNAFIARLVHEMLSSSDLDLELKHVPCLADARERVVASRPACILLDLTLPDAEGLASLLEIRKIAPDVPVVVLSGIEDEALAVRAVQEGAQDYLMKRRVDLQGLARSLRYAIERRDAQQQLLDQRLQDEVTGLPTRTLFADRVRVALARNDPRSIGVLLLNVDRFRVVNDTFGHDAGDQVLAAVARRLLTELSGDASVANFGADEFAVLVEATEPEALLELADELRKVLEEPYEIAGEEIRLAITAGTASGSERGAEALLREADAALSRGKAQGGGRVETFDESVRAGLLGKLRLERELRAGIEQGQLRLFYQPIVSLESGDTMAFEALVRWEHPERGLVPPFEFLPLAEESGLSPLLCHWVLSEACGQLATWHSDHPGWRQGTMNVNVSGTELADPQLVERVEQALAANGLPASALCLEVTETALIRDLDLSGEILGRLKALGVQTALDDFGTGYSSLSYLERFPIDVLKLDRSFVVALRTHRRPAIVAAVASMARGLRLPSVAEGVEEKDEETELRGFGYDLAQGFFYARPLPASEAVAALLPTTNGGAS